MFRKTKAVQALQDCCSRLGLPAMAATALLQFLSAKRVHDQYVEGKQLRMSPGATIDRLWHFMLLNTQVSSQVHELLGGVVEHRGIDAADLDDDTKLLQRLYALSILLLEGHNPDVTLWMEPHTAMLTLYQTAAPVPALQPLPGGGRLYVTPALSQQQQTQLVQALQALYAQEGGPAATSNIKQEGVVPPNQSAVPPAAVAAGCAAAVGGGAAAAAATTVPLAAVAVGCGGAAAVGVPPPAKRARAELDPQPAKQQQQQQPAAVGDDPGRVKFIVTDMTKPPHDHVSFDVATGVRLQKIMQLFCDKMSLELAAMRFVYNGARISPDHTVSALGIRPGDEIQCFRMQTGC